MDEPAELKVTYTAKELLGRIDKKLESIDEKLDTKAGIHDLLAVQQDVKAVETDVERIDREGSTGTRPILGDHETRLRSLEQWKYGIPSAVALALLAALGTGVRLILGG
jgi:hypothetical protein